MYFKVNNFTAAFTFLVLILSSSFVHAQLLDIKNYSENTGLPGNSITTIYQTTDGFIWLGIKGNGLSKFNGQYSDQFTTNQGLKDDTVTHIFEDKNNILWVATKTGGLAQLKGSEISYLSGPLSSQNIAVSSIFESDNGDLWVGTKEHGLFRKRGTRFQQYNLPDETTFSTSIDALWENKQGLWVFGNAGIHIIDIQEGSLKKELPSFVDHTFYAITPSNQYDVWIPTDRGLYFIEQGELHKSDPKLRTWPDSETIIKVIETKFGNLITLTDSGTIFFSDQKNSMPITTENGLSSNRISDIFKDQENRFWVLTEDKGVDLVRNPPLIRYDTSTFLPSNKVYTIFSHNTPSPSLWFGTDKGLAVVQNDSTSLVSPLPVDVNFPIKDIDAFPNGDLLLLTTEGKCYRYTPFRDLRLFAVNSFGYQITDILIDHDNTLYAGTNKGLIIKENNTHHFLDIDSGLAGNFVLHINQNENGEVLVGTDQGLSILRGTEIVTPKIFSVDQLQTQIRYVLGDSNSQYWLGTNEGIIRVDTTSAAIDVFDNGVGLRTVDTQSLFMKDQVLWHATSSGLHKLIFDEEELVTVIHLTYQHNIRGITANHRAVAESHGTLWFGADQGVFSYSNQFENTDTQTPKVNITDLRVDFLRDQKNQLSASIQLDDEIQSGPVEHFKEHENNLTFYFQGLDYSSPENITYQYKLENFDADWSASTKMKSTSFQSLEPGRYIFHLKAQNEKGLESTQIASFPFVIETPFWNSYWFFGLLILSFVGLIFGGERLRLQWLEKKKLQKMVEHRTEYLEATLKEKEILIQEVHHRIKNNLAVISGLMELQRSQFEDELSTHVLLEAQMRVQSIALIHEKLYQNDTLAKIDFEKYVTDLINIIASSYNFENKDISVQIEVDDLELNLDQSIPCGLIMNELVSNAYEHAFKGREGGRICVKFLQKGSDVECIIQDNGIGLPNTDIMESSSLGLTLVRTLVSQLEGTLKMDSTEAGSQFKILFEKEPIAL